MNTRRICDIAAEIKSDWKKVNFAAKPYLEAMFSLETLNDKYYHDDARSILTYFLCNASTWRGDVAKRVKKELKSMLGLK